MYFNSQRALELLRRGTSIPDAKFRPGQKEAIRHVVENRERLVVIQSTGWGKSFVYFIATRLLRESGAGPALLVSPLLSLMRNQIQAAQKIGVRAVRYTSDNQEQWPEVRAKLYRDEVDILLIAPERFANERFMTTVLARISARISLFVIDECHCISDWGHDFRPDYLRIERIAQTLPRNMRLLATTATANSRVMNDLRQIFGSGLGIQRGPLARPSLTLQTIRIRRQSERLAWLAQAVPRLPGFGIIYTLTVRDAEIVADWLRSRNINVKAYTGKTEGRETLENELLQNRVKALVATVALGMGFDKPDLSFVIHYQTPGSVVAYYQQVGRAGRALETARGILLSGEEETDITDYFINSAFPTPEEAHQVITTLGRAPQGLSVAQLENHVNLTRNRISLALKLLSLESPAPIVKQGSKWQLGVAPLQNSFWERTRRLTELRRQEQAEMQKYVALERGHMEFLIRALDGDTTGITPPRLPPFSIPLHPQAEKAAQAYLRELKLPIEPRKRWPYKGVLGNFGVYGIIQENHRAEKGRALCLWGDGGWGGLVKAGKQRDNRFSQELVTACVSLIYRWNPYPKPEWVTCIPSLRNPHLVDDFARRLATALRLPFSPVIAQTRMRPAQKSMANSSQQARNLDGTLRIALRFPPRKPVLLVDDIISSGWTITVAAWLLRQQGSGPVWPLALSMLRKS